MAQDLRFQRQDELFVAIDEAGLIFQDYQRLGHAVCEERIGIVELPGNADRAALVVYDPRGRPAGDCGDDRVILFLFADSQRGQRRQQQKNKEERAGHSRCRLAVHRFHSGH